MQALTYIDIPGIKPSYQGKVRDIYDLGDTLVMVTTDRVSAYDYVFNEGIPGKGKIITQISNSWFSRIGAVENHLISTNVAEFPEPFSMQTNALQDRAVLVQKTERIPFECVVRGHLMGSGYEDYLQSGAINEITLPPNLRMGERLPEPVFTPTTKSDSGHDKKISFEYLTEALGTEVAERLRTISLQVYQYAYEFLEKKGILLMDTKFEFGWCNGTLFLIDEVLTPDSSRFCYRDQQEKAVEEGDSPPNLDKQIIRNYLNEIGWNRKPPLPPLTKEVIEQTKARYEELQELMR